MEEFDYVVPHTIDEAVSALAQKGKAARVLAGGTDILVQMRGGRRIVERLVDIKEVPEANQLLCDPDSGLQLGSGVPCYKIYQDQAVANTYPGLGRRCIYDRRHPDTRQGDRRR